MKGKSGIFIFFITLLAVAAIVYWVWITPSIAPLKKGNGEFMPSPEEKDSILVEDQTPAGSVYIAKVTLSQDGWVVIHDEREGKPGLIIAAARFDAGTYENRDVDLLGQKTEAGKTYFAMLHRDDGDRQFNYTKDLPITDSSDNVVAMKFRAIVAAGEDGPVDTSAWKTYRNEEYGFEVKYPQGWELREGPADELNPSIVSLYKREAYIRILISGSVNDIRSFVDAERGRLDYVRSLPKVKGSIEYSYPEVSSFAGEEAVLQQQTDGEFIRGKYITMPQKGIYMYTNDHFDNDISISINKILSTFKFIN